MDATVSIDDESVAENVVSGTVTFTATLSTAVNTDVVLAVAITAGTADLTDDLGTLPESVTIFTGATEGTFTVPIVNDPIVEGDETFTVTLSQGATPLPEGVTIRDGNATGTIENDDRGAIQLSPNVATAAEDATFTYTVSVSSAADEAVIVRWTASAESGDTATVADDLQAPRTDTVTFDAGTRVDQTFTISPFDDDLDEDNETFTVTLGPDTQGGNPLPTDIFILDAANSSKATIIDNDDTPVVNATVSIDDASVAENVSGGNAEFTVSLTAAVNSDVTLAVAYADGTATLATDLGTPPTTVTIDQGQTEATLLVPIADDSTVEGDEDFTVTISEGTTSLPDGVTIGTDATATGTITDNDMAEVTLSPPTLTAAEDATFTYTVSLSAAADEAVTVRWTATDGTAIVADDLQATTNTVTFAANDNTAQEFTISPFDDNEDEVNETFTVTLEVDTEGGNSLPTGVSIGTAKSSTATITDNDDPPVVNATVSIDDASVAENVSGGNAEFTVSLTAAVNSDVTLAVAYADGTATLATDLGTPPTTVTIDQGQTEATLLVPVADDGTVEGDEDFTVTISEGTTPLPEGVTIGTDATATGTITDNDMAEVTLSPPTLTAAEDATFTYTVSLSAAADEAVTVRWTATDGTAIVADDLQATTNTVTFAANDNTAQEFTISPFDDNEDEVNETFTVTLEVDTEGGNSLPTGVSIGTAKSSTATITDNDDPPVVNATVSIDDASVAENVSGGNAEFTVSLTAAVNSDVTLAVAYADGTATLATDLGTPPTTVTIDQGQTEATLLVPIADDSTVEGDEDFTVTISEGTTSLPDGVTIGTDATATGTITDNDMAEVTLSPPTLTAAEDATFTYTVSLSAAADEAVTVRWTATDGTAIVADDLQATTNTVTFAANDNTAQEFTISPFDDNEDEDNETFTVTLEVDTEGGNSLPTGVSIGTAKSSTATITDNDATPVVNATVSIDDASVAENVSGGNAEFTVSLTVAVNSDVTLAVAYTDGTATLATDLGTPPTTVTIDQGQTEATLLVPIADDGTVEGDEDFTVTISEGTTPLPEGVTIGTDATATGTITDNDMAEVTLSPPTLTAAEDATFTYTVSLSAAADEAVTVRWTATDGTAIVADDLQATTNTVTFAANDNTAQEFTISPFDDNEDEVNETFTVTLEVDTEGGNSLPTGVSIGTSNSSEATITDDDDTPVVTATVDIDDESVVENVSSGNATFTATLSQAVNSPVVLAVEVTAGTATLGVDLGTDLPTTVAIDQGQTEATFTVPITDDNIVEGDETFTVTLSQGDTLLPEGVTISDGVATGTITENDEAEVTLTATTSTANENGGTFSYTVNLSNPADDAVIVRWTATDGTATVVNDLQSTTNTVTFNANSNTAQTFTISPTDDNEDEDNETFTVTLGADDDNPLPTGVSIGTSNSSEATIIDDDDTPVVTATVDIDDESVVENVSSGNATFTATLSQAVGSPVVLAVEVTAGTATLGVDLGTDLPTTVTIDQGQTEATFTVPITDDNIVEGDETFTVTLSESDTTALPEGVTIPDGIATGTITENDEAEVTLTATTSTANENGGTFSYTVNLSNPADEAVIVRWTATDGTATVVNDLQSTTNTVTFNANANTAQTFTISPTDDNEDEDNETFTVTLGADDDNPLPTGVTIGTSNSSEATITDDDDTPVVTATVDIDDESVVENISGGNATFTATLSQAVGSPVVLAVEVTAGTATLGVDLGTDLPTTVTIDQGQTEATFTVPITDDNIVEGDETFTVTLSQGDTLLPEGVTIPDGVATGTITENDEAEVTLTATTSTANENGGTFSYTVNLSNPADDAVIVRWTATDGTATVANDLQSTTNTVTFNANANTAQTFTISPTNDNEDEDNETFTVTLGADDDNPLPTGVTIGTSNSSEATIIDDDDTPVVTATVDIDDESVVENVSGGNATFTATLSQAVNSPVVLAVEVTVGTATLGVDLGTDLPTTVTIDQGQTEATFTVPITDDNIVEGDETFTVTLSESDTTALPEGVTIPDGIATGTITENDEAEVTLTATTSTANENGGTFSYTVNLSNPADDAVIVRWTATDGTATVANDLQSTTNTVTFNANANTAQTFTISPTNDNEDEDNETFTVTLGADDDNPLPTGVTIGTSNSSEATIIDDDDTPVVTATVDIDDESVVENVSGGNATFTATLSQAVNSPVVLAVEVTAGTATLGVDLGTDLPTTVTIDQGQTEATFTVPITDDNIVEGDETFTVTLSESDTTALPEGVTIPDGIATGTITENDEAEVTLTATTSTANENGGTFSYTVNLSNPADDAVIVRWTATDGTATVVNDLQSTTNTVTFNANDNTAQTFTISPANDNEDEDNETFTVTLGADDDNPLPTGVSIGTANNSEATIIDDDDTPVVTATVDIDDESVVENVSSGNATFTATLSQAVGSPVVLAVEVTAGTATLGVDLGTDLPTTVTIDQGQTEATFTVPITDDNIVEGDETFTVTLSQGDTALPEGVTIRDGVATGTITENDEAEVTLTATTSTANENGGTFSYTVNLSNPADDAVIVRWTATDGTATVVNDLQATTNTVTFNANDNTAQTFTISPTDDNEDEDNETFTVTLGADDDNPLPTGVTIGTSNSSEATIIDDDDTPVVTATVDIDDESVVENVSSGNATFTATLSQAVNSPVVLAVEVTAGTATLGVDLGTDLPTTVTIDQGQTEATFTVPITDDNIVEGDETFTVTLSQGDTALPEGVTIRDGVATGTITENDAAEVTLSPPTLTAAEDATFTYTVSLSAMVDEAVIVRWTATDGTAIVAEDLQATTSTVTFNANTNANQTFTISPVNDIEDEDDETFTVTLAADTQGGNSLPTGVTIGTANSSTATITDNDDTPVPGDDAMVRIADAPAVAEEDAGSASFRISLDRAVDSDVVLAVAYAAGTAALADLGSDRPTTVTIDEGETEATLSVPIVNDTIVEGNETFTVTVTTATAGVGIADGIAMGTITDSDTAVISHQTRKGEVSEGGSSSSLIALSAPVSRPITITWTAIAGDGDTATVEDDLHAPHTGTVTFPANDATGRNYTIRAVADDLDEPDETFRVTIEATGALPARVTIDPDGDSRAVTILDRDDAPPSPGDDTTVNIADAAAVVEGAGNASFTVSLDAAVSGDVVLGVTYGGGPDNPATPADDLGSDRPTTVTIEEGETEATLSVPIVDDDIVEGDETFTVTLAINDAPEGVSIGDGVATGTITDNDDAPPPPEDPEDDATVNIADAAAVVEGAGNASFTVSLDTAVSGDVVLGVTYGGGPNNPATPADDLGSDRPTTVTIDEGETEATLSVPIVDDDIVEGDETFTVTLAINDAPEGVSIGDGAATGTITDNDEEAPDDATVNITDAAAVLEGAGNASFTVSLDAAVSGDVVLGVTYGGGPDNPATPADDLGSDRPTTVTIDEGETEATLSVPIVDDDIVEGDETFTVTLAVNDAPEGVSIGDGVATGTIEDDDEEALELTISIADAAPVPENGTARFTISLEPQALTSDAVLDVAYAPGPATGDTQPATPADDLGSDRLATVTIDEGSRSVVLEVPIADDGTVEGDETFTVTLSAAAEQPDDPETGLPPNFVLLFSRAVATGTIEDDDVAEVSISPAEASVMEGEAFTFTVGLSQAVSRAVTLDIAYTAVTADPATDLGSDRPATVTIPANRTAVSFDVPSVADTLVEGDETFTVTITGADPPDGVNIADAVARGTIEDDDVAEVSISPAEASVREGETFTFTVSLSQAVGRGVVLDIAYAAVTADPATDLVSDRPATVTIPANRTTASFDVPTVDDTIVEDDETFTVTLAVNDALGGVNIVDGVATGTIENDDAAEVSISPAEASVMEGETFTFQVRLSQAVGRAVVLDIAYAAGTADPATDLVSDRPATVTIPANRTAASFDVPSVDDTLAEDDETFTVTITTATAGFGIAAGVATGTIENDDAVKVSISPAEASVRESETFTFQVRLSQAMGRAVTLDIAYAADTADPATDLVSDRPATVTIPANRTTASFDVPTVDDTLVEDDETFTVTVAGDDLPGGMSVGSAVARGTIENDDAAEVSISPAEASVREGEAFTFTVSLSQAVSRAVTVRWTAAGSGGRPATLSGESSDLAQDQAVTDTLTFDAGETAEWAFTLATRNDDLVEGGETLTATIVAEGELPANVSIVTGTAAGTIIDLASVLIEPRRIGAGAALRHHVKRFESTTGTVVRSRLAGRAIKTLTASENHGNGGGAVGGGFGKTDWGAWIDGAYAGFGGNATGRHADIYGGVDYRGGNGDWLIGALIGYELADLDIGEATYDADYTHFGLYAGARLSERLLVDVAATYGFATPEVALGDVSASYDANRFTVRGGVTGDFGFAKGSVTVAPELTAVYSRERLGAFTDSTGEGAGRELLELGRFGAGPRLAWRFGPGQLTGSARMQWDFLALDDGVDGRFSGTAEVELRFDLGGGVGLGFYGDVDGIGIVDDFVTYGGKAQLDVEF